MRKKHRPLLFLLPLSGLLALGVALVWGTNVAVLNPRGTVARQEFELIIFTCLLSLVVVIPVFFLTFFIAWKYRAGNKRAKYQPEWDRSRIIESVWWLIPLVIIAILAVVTWVTTHRLDPYRPLAASKKPLTVQVVALQWKWLFIYPEQNIASVNHLQIPVGRPINFLITSDAPMNSFWIPQLGGQVYAMSGMQTKLHLLADQTGTYRGVSANISGSGFSGMNFVVKAGTQKDFDTWVVKAKGSPAQLSWKAYETLAMPSKNEPVRFYSASDKNLYDTVIMKYTEPGMHSTNYTNEDH